MQCPFSLPALLQPPRPPVQSFFTMQVLTISYLVELNISYLVSVTKDVGSVAAKQVNVLLAIQIPNFAAISSRIKL